MRQHLLLCSVQLCPTDFAWQISSGLHLVLDASYMLQVSNDVLQPVEFCSMWSCLKNACMMISCSCAPKLGGQVTHLCHSCALAAVLLVSSGHLISATLALASGLLPFTDTAFNCSCCNCVGHTGSQEVPLVMLKVTCCSCLVIACSSHISFVQ